MQRHELWAFHIPVRLFGLEHQINTIGQATIQQLDQFRPLLFGKTIASFVHDGYFLLIHRVCIVLSAADGFV